MMIYRRPNHDEITTSRRLPIDQVYAALEELIRTHRRPTCVAWVAA